MLMYRLPFQDGIMQRRVLDDKSFYIFGGHAKGGGCDWMLPVKLLKFHSRLMVKPPCGWTGYCVTLQYMRKQVCWPGA